jgi:hypothetical protein
VSSFVRRGADVGEVTITLSTGDPRRPRVIRRRITARANSSEWWLDGEGGPALLARV